MPGNDLDGSSFHASYDSIRNDRVLKKYLLEKSSIFPLLCKLRDEACCGMGNYQFQTDHSQVWSKKEADEHFRHRRNRADHPTNKQRTMIFNMTRQIGNALAQETHVFDLEARYPLILDLCMAPGGFTDTAIRLSPHATVHAITLPANNGGHQVMARSTNLTAVSFADITMFAADFGVEEIPADHPDRNSFRLDRPYSDHQYDLIFCGGAVVRNQVRAPYRNNVEAKRLTLSQLIFAFNRIKPGGSLVLLLHRVELWETARIIYGMATLADIQLFKPRKAHAKKSSFYLVAKNVRSESKEAADMVAKYKRDWYHITFGSPQNDEMDSSVDGVHTGENIESILEEFGPRLTELGDQVWEIQADTLSDYLHSIRGSGIRNPED